MPEPATSFRGKKSIQPEEIRVTREHIRSSIVDVCPSMRRQSGRSVMLTMRKAVLLSIMMSVMPLFGQAEVAEQAAVAAAAATSDQNAQETPPEEVTPQSQRPLRVITNGTNDRIVKFSGGGSTFADSILKDSDGSVTLTNSVTGSPRLFMQYTAAQGNGSDVTGQMGATQTFSFGFNSEGSFTGAAAQLSGRQLVFYDRAASAYRGALDATGTWWFGSAPTNFGLKVLAPSGSVTGMTIGETGNVGIGTTSPSSRLHVVGSAIAGNSYTLNGVTNGRQLFTAETSGLASGYGYASVIGAGGGSGGVIKTNPLASYGANGVTGFAYDAGGGGRAPIAVYGYTLQNAANLTNTGNRPAAGVFISELGGTSSNFGGTIYGVYGKADSSAAINSISPSNVVGVYGIATGQSNNAVIGGYFTGSGGTSNYGVYSAAGTNHFAGAVGIGTTLPTAGMMLHVVGNARFDGSVTGTNIRANYQDLAEWVPSADDLSPATVVVLDKRTGNTVKASAASYDTSVAGVVSAQPGIILGEEGVSKEQIATTGRVRVRVDASKGAIEIGDLLVTSDISGTAMKSAPIDIGGFSIHRPGTIIGKALEPLRSGTGEILVLLSLQ